MVLKWMIYVIVFNCFPVFSKELSRLTGPEEVDYMPCDDGWLHFRQKCYKFEGDTDENQKSWEEAATVCTTYGGHLVSIHSKSELDFLVNTIIIPFKLDAWIGMHDRDLESIFIWQDGSSINYTNFMIGEPNHRFPDEDCIRMIYNDWVSGSMEFIGQWRDTQCPKNHSYICQKKIVPPPETDETENSTSSVSVPLSVTDEIENLPISTTVFAKEIPRTTVSNEVGNITCDIGWQYFRQKCYKLGGETKEGKKSWEAASIICTTYGGYLVSINSEAELDFLVNNIIRPFKKAAWIGLHDRDSESIFTWQDGSPVNYTNYMIGEPNHRFPDEDCIRMIYNDRYSKNMEVIGQWRDTLCSDNYSYICQKKKIPPSVPPSVTRKTEKKPSSKANKYIFRILMGIGIILLLKCIGIAMCYFRPWEKCSRRRSPDTQPIKYRAANDSPTS